MNFALTPWAPEYLDAGGEDPGPYADRVDGLNVRKLAVLAEPHGRTIFTSLFWVL